MELNTKELACDLLNRIANSVIEREINPIELFFTSNEIEVVRSWLDDKLIKTQSPT